MDFLHGRPRCAGFEIQGPSDIQRIFREWFCFVSPVVAISSVHAGRIERTEDPPLLAEIV